MKEKFGKSKNLIIFSTIATIVLFIFSFFFNEKANIITKIIAIAYILLFILYLLFAKEKLQVKRLPGKKDRTKKFTGSTYRKIFHRKECRFADSIKDEYFIENDDKDFFKKQGYKACKLCLGKNVDETNLKQKK
jgi:Ca2+/Na+ antiporter